MGHPDASKLAEGGHDVSRLSDDLREIHRGCVRDRSVGKCQCSKIHDDGSAVFDFVGEAVEPGRILHSFRVPVRVVKGALDDGQRRLDLVRHVAGKLAQGLERALQPVEQLIQRHDQGGELAIGWVHLDAT